jgi:hypothetical protein
MIMPRCGETPDIQRAIPIAKEKNAHRWMFLIIPSLSWALQHLAAFGGIGLGACYD